MFGHFVSAKAFGLFWCGWEYQYTFDSWTLYRNNNIKVWTEKQLCNDSDCHINAYSPIRFVLLTQSMPHIKSIRHHRWNYLTLLYPNSRKASQKITLWNRLTKIMLDIVTFILPSPSFCILILLVVNNMIKRWNYRGICIRSCAPLARFKIRAKDPEQIPWIWAPESPEPESFFRFH